MEVKEREPTRMILRRVGHIGLTLLELLIAMGLLTAFLALTHDALRKVLLYPRVSLQRFSDRSGAMNVERFLVGSTKAAQEGYLWAKSSETGTTVLMGLAREFRPPSEPPVTEYQVFAFFPQKGVVLRWTLTPDEAKSAVGHLSPDQELSDGDWEALRKRAGQSQVANNVTKFVYELGPEEKPVHFEVEVNSSRKDASGNLLGPPHRIERWLSKVRDETN